jgi:hypothetical protein
LPVVIAKDRQSVSPLIGYRHISGIQPWNPYQQSRFIAWLFAQGLSVEKVASIVGERTTDVLSHFRNQAIVKQAQDEFHLDTARVTDSFGVFTRAMQSTVLREFIGVTRDRWSSASPVPFPPSRLVSSRNSSRGSSVTLIMPPSSETQGRSRS